IEGLDTPAIDVVAGLTVGRVRARAAGEGVVAGAADHQVVAVVPVDRIVPLTADEDVVVIPAVERQRLDATAGQGRGADDDVPARRVNRQRVVGRLGVGDGGRHLRGEDRHRAAAAGEAHDVHADGAVDGHRVGRGIAGPVDAEVEIDVGDVGRG